MIYKRVITLLVLNVSAELSNDFVTACIRSTWLYIVETNFGNIGLYYKNVFCYACLFGIDAVEIRILATWRQGRMGII